jgi:hypothetical protein
VPFIGAEGEGGGQTVQWWWWLSGAITLAVSALNEGEAKRQGWCPLRGGEGVDREAAEHGGTPTLGREVAAPTC